MRRIVITFFILLVFSTSAYSQSRYIPLGMNGTAASISTGFTGDGFNSARITAGYGIGGRLDLNLQGGVSVTDINGISEVVPNFSFGFDTVMIKQQRAVPFSLVVGLRVGFASALPDDREIFGTNFGFNLLLSHDIWIKDKFLIGLNGIFVYDRLRFNITDNSTDPATDSEYRSHDLRMGPAVDFGFKYFEDNLLVLRGDLLWNLEGTIEGRVNLIIVIPTTK